MISWQMIPALRVAVGLAIGIACTALPPLQTNFNAIASTIAAISLLLLFWPIPLEFRVKYRGFGILSATIVVGLLLGFNSKLRPPSTIGENAKAFIATLDRPPTVATTWFSVDARITSFRSDTGWTESNSKVRILLPPARLTDEMQTGATFLFNSKVNKVTSAGNPHAFDYASYLTSQGIALQAFVPASSLNGSDEAVVFLKKGRPPKKLARLRQWIALRIDLALPTPNEAAVAKALFLGDKSGLSEDTRKNYTRTGAVHVLAVSGLHTGIIASIIIAILGFVRWRKELYWLKLLVFWASLFSYAALTDFSPSVQRSAVMFGILFAGKILRKDTNGFNSLGLSAIILLAFDPQLLFELGFQLSYCAVAGILAFYPKLRKMFAAENYWLNAMGELNAVSIAATIGTLPLTTFYFHQIPVYFLLSGILAVPLVGLALPALIGAIGIDALFAFFGSSAYWAYVPAYLFIWLCNACLEAIAAFPNALVSGLWPTAYTTTLALTAVAFGGAAIMRRRKRLYWAALTFGLFWSVSIGYTTLGKLKTKQELVYSLRDGILVDAFENGRVKSSGDIELKNLTSRSTEMVNTHRVALNARLDTSTSMILRPDNGAYSPIRFGIANDRRFAILGEDKQQLTPTGPMVDFVIIPEAKAIDPKQLVLAFPSAKYVLASNIPPWKKEDWEPLTTSLHSLKKDGAFILEQ